MSGDYAWLDYAQYSSCHVGIRTYDLSSWKLLSSGGPTGGTSVSNFDHFRLKFHQNLSHLGSHILSKGTIVYLNFRELKHFFCFFWNLKITLVLNFIFYFTVAPWLVTRIDDGYLSKFQRWTLRITEGRSPLVLTSCSGDRSKISWHHRAAL